jgi:hypothetical protein
MFVGLAPSWKMNIEVENTKLGWLLWTVSWLRLGTSICGEIWLNSKFTVL